MLSEGKWIPKILPKLQIVGNIESSSHVPPCILRQNSMWPTPQFWYQAHQVWKFLLSMLAVQTTTGFSAFLSLVTLLNTKIQIENHKVQNLKGFKIQNLLNDDMTPQVESSTHETPFHAKNYWKYCIKSLSG